MKLGLKQRLAILDRAYDKAAKFLPGETNKLAEMERSVLTSAITWSSNLSRYRRKDYRDRVRQHFGWDHPANIERFAKTLEEIRNGQRV